MCPEVGQLRTVVFWLGGTRWFRHKVPTHAIETCYALHKSDDRFVYWRAITGDERIDGHVMMWWPDEP